MRQLFETNVTGLLALSQTVFPHMAARGAGRIVNVGSIVQLLATPFGGAYAASKAAVHLLSDAPSRSWRGSRRPCSSPP